MSEPFEILPVSTCQWYYSSPYNVQTVSSNRLMQRAAFKLQVKESLHSVVFTNVKYNFEPDMDLTLLHDASTDSGTGVIKGLTQKVIRIQS